MAKFLLLVTLVIVALVALNRERVFLRDPLGKVERAGLQVSGARVFINYPNDVLVQEGSQVYLVQGWNKAPGVPVTLSCIQALACLTDGDHATSLPLLAGTRPATDVRMTNREVSFVGGDGVAVRITLR